MNSSAATLNVLGGFEVTTRGTRHEVPMQAQRVLAYLAVCGRQRVRRGLVAGTLWAHVGQRRASANLRNAVWRINQVEPGLLDLNRTVIGVEQAVEIDLLRARQCAEQMLTGERSGAGSVLRLLDHDLLPTWDDDWLLVERERQRQLRMHALERLSERLREAGRHTEAIVAALSAVRAEPLRESAQRQLVVAHLAEGNVCEAVRQFNLYRTLLWEELAIGPGHELSSIIDRATGHAPKARPVRPQAKT